LQIQVDYLEDHPEIFCVGGHAVKIDKDGNSIGIMSYPPLTNEEIVREIVERKKNPIINPTVMFSKGTFYQIGRYTFQPDIYTVQDFDLWCKAILHKCKLHNLQKPLIQYRVNPVGMTRSHQEEMIIAHANVWGNLFRELGKRHRPKR